MSQNEIKKCIISKDLNDKYQGLKSLIANLMQDLN